MLRCGQAGVGAQPIASVTLMPPVSALTGGGGAANISIRQLFAVCSDSVTNGQINVYGRFHRHAAGWTGPLRLGPSGTIDVTPLGLLQMAVQQKANVDQLTKLFELQERWQASQACQAYNAAMAKFKHHATLDHVTEAIIQTLSAVGISHRWKVSQSPEIAVTCVLTHEMGHSEETTLKALPDTSGSKNSIQAIGSTVTYLERYTLLAATGMAAAGTDNDGRLADEEQKPKISEARLPGRSDLD